MASPQLENGHIRIANDLFQAILHFPFTHREQSIVFAIIRLTYGYGKKFDTMTHYQVSKVAGLRRDSVAKSIPKLIAMNVITVHNSCTVIRGQKVSEIGINKDYETWTTVHKLAQYTNCDRTQSMYGDRTQTGTPTVHKLAHSINNTKDNKNIGRVAPLKPQKPNRGKTKGTRLPESWGLPDEWAKWARQNFPLIDPIMEADKFRDYWVSKTGASATKLDWLATWRNWCRSADEYRGKANGRQKPSCTDATKRILAEIESNRQREGDGAGAVPEDQCDLPRKVGILPGR